MFHVWNLVWYRGENNNLFCSLSSTFWWKLSKWQGLIAAGETSDSPAIQRACQFLVEHQNSDGGWGEDSRSCSENKWVKSKTSQVVHTRYCFHHYKRFRAFLSFLIIESYHFSWALLSLLAAKYPNRSVIERGVKVWLRKATGVLGHWYWYNNTHNTIQYN